MKAASKREQSDACIDSAECEQARLQVKAASKREQSDACIDSAECEQARAKLTLYHGSNVIIDQIDLSKSRPFKDFGRAFYLSADEQQAWERAYAAVNIWGGEPYVTAFEFDESLMNAGEMKVLQFDAYTEQWADFIFANRNRRKPAFSHDYDIVYGPIANDKVGEQVVLFKGGYITKERFLRKLKNMKGITFQYAFCTEAAIAKLKKL